MEQQNRKLLRIANVARRLDCHRATIIRRIVSGDLEAVKFGAHWRVYADSVEAALKKVARA
jgi:excisionase family DNA binding protein